MYTEFEQWRDSFHCGGFDTREEPERKTVEIGTKLYLICFGEPECSMIVTVNNKAWIERKLNDRNNDVTEYYTLEELKRYFPEYIPYLNEYFPLEPEFVPAPVPEGLPF